MTLRTMFFLFFYCGRKPLASFQVPVPPAQISPRRWPCWSPQSLPTLLLVSILSVSSAKSSRESQNGDFAGPKLSFRSGISRCLALFSRRNGYLSTSRIQKATSTGILSDKQIPSKSTTEDFHHLAMQSQRLDEGADSPSVVYYLGIGSNMLRSKVENRGLNGSKIEIRSMHPAYVPDYRLAFNLKGFPPIEPGMGGIEPALGQVCHGALIELTPTEYHKLWLSEGGGQANPGYEEIEVDAYIYDNPAVSSRSSETPTPTPTLSLSLDALSCSIQNKTFTIGDDDSAKTLRSLIVRKKVRAVALRAREHVRLRRDAEPSRRYMDMLIKGAKELNMDAAYIEKLEAIPTADPPKFLRFLATKQLNLATLLFRWKMQRVFRVLVTNLVWLFYVPSQSRNVFMRVVVGQFMLGLAMLPTAVIGLLIEWFYRIVLRKELTSPFVAMLKKQQQTTTAPVPAPAAAAAAAPTTSVSEPSSALTKASAAGI